MPTHKLFSSPIHIKDFEGAELEEIQESLAAAILRLTPKRDEQRHHLDTTFDFDGVNDIRRSNIEPLAWAIWAAMKEYFHDLVLTPINLEIGESWFNFYKEGDFMYDHEHPSGVVSGVYYYAMPENAGGDIYFRSPNPLMHHRVWPQCGDASFQQFKVEPKVGRLILFPSWLTHSVMPVTGTEQKISVSFNLCPPPIPMAGPSNTQF